MAKAASRECSDCGSHTLTPPPTSIFFDEDAFATALVAKLQAALPAMLALLDNKACLTIEHPALVKPIVITFHSLLPP